MPVDLSIPNSIIGAYAQGRAEALARQQRLDLLAKQQKDDEFRQQQAEEAKSEFEQTLAQHDKETTAHLNLLTAAHKLDVAKAMPIFQETFEKRGNVPGFEAINPQAAPGMLDTGQRTLVASPDLGLGPISFGARTPQQTSADEIAQGIAQRAPIRQEGLQDYASKSFIDEARLEELERLKNKDLTQHDKEMMSLEAGYKNAQSSVDYQHKLGEIDEQMKWEMAIKGSQSFEPWTALPIDPETQKKLGVPEGSTWGNLGVDTMDDVGKKKFTNYNEMENEANQVTTFFKGLAQAKIEKGRFPNTPAGRDQALKSAYGDYFSGSWGNIQDLFPNYTATDITNIVKPHLGRMFLIAKEVSNLGSALTENEAKLQSRFTLTGDRNITPEAAMSILNNIVPMIRQARLDTVQSYGKGKGGSIERIKIPAPGGVPR